MIENRSLSCADINVISMYPLRFLVTLLAIVLVCSMLATRIGANVPAWASPSYFVCPTPIVSLFRSNTSRLQIHYLLLQLTLSNIMIPLSPWPAPTANIRLFISCNCGTIIDRCVTVLDGVI